MRDLASPYPEDAEIWQLALALGLQPYPVLFETVPSAVLYEFAAYLIPGRMAHWSFGKQYQMLKTQYDYGMGKLYEMVVNTNPAYAFLLESNSPLENTLVRCHVMGHVDFFRTNHAFASTPADMVDLVSHHADRIRQYEYQYGHATVEDFLDSALAIEEHVDWPAPLPQPPKLHAPPRVLPKRYADLQPGHHEPEMPRTRPVSDPSGDLMQFIINYSETLEDWQRDVLNMVAEEMRYFWPQMRTKLMNEGWATYWHLKLMHELDLSDQDYVDFARVHAAVVAPRAWQVNPYGLGYQLFASIERSEGIEMMFLCREVEEDVGFVRNHLTAELVEELQLFTFGRDQQEVVVKSRNWKDVRDQLIRELTHAGIPVIRAQDGDYHHRGELYLQHQHDGLDLDMPYAKRTLEHIYKLWGRPVYLETVTNHHAVILNCDTEGTSQRPG